MAIATTDEDALAVIEAAASAAGIELVRVGGEDEG